MTSIMRISLDTQRKLRCPVCRSPLEISNTDCICLGSECKAHFPIVNGIPVILNEKNSLYSLQESIGSLAHPPPIKRTLRRALKKILPTIDSNPSACRNYRRFLELIMNVSSPARVLVIGGSVLGEGIGVLADNHHVELVETDVTGGPRTMVILDAHDIPFENESFDGAVIQAVLEHTVDPWRCVDEIHRVLKRDGLVYAETAFIQQVHMGRYDFYRFTHLGHRRLFRKFIEIDSGPACGPGMALAWSYRYFLLSFIGSSLAKDLLHAFASLTSFFLKYPDRSLVKKAGSYDAASAFFFLGRKHDEILSDRELIKLYKGAG
jgi:uncharacterized protein YbaR (Trm112 family)